MTDQTRTRDDDSSDSVTRTYHDWENGHRLSLTVIGAIAAHRATDPIELDPLHSIVDLEALEALVASFDRADDRVTFTDDGNDITVWGDGVVTVHHTRGDPYPPDGETAFRTALARLVRAAAANGVAVDGEWTCADESDAAEWRVTISGGE